MDLNITEVATLLQVSIEEVQKWLDQGSIPSYKIQNEIRFSREEIENWVVRSHDQVHIETSESTLGPQHFNLFRALHKGFVLSDVEGKTKEELIKNSVQVIAEKLDLDAQTITDLLIEREKLMSTALNSGVAVPHTRDFLIPFNYDIVVVVYPKEPIDYDALDQKPVHTLFFLFASQDKKHLSLLAKIAYFCNQADHLEYLKQKPLKKELLHTVQNWEASLADLQPA